jgi:hypothetical protein
MGFNNQELGAFRVPSGDSRIVGQAKGMVMALTAILHYIRTR